MTLTLTQNERRWGWFFLVAQLLVVAFAVALICALLGITSMAAITAATFYVNAALALLIFRRLLIQSFRNCVGKWKQTVLLALRGFGMYWVINYAITVLILLIDPEFSNVNDVSVGSMLNEMPLFMGLAVVVAAPLAEECLFRGWMFTGLARKSLPLAYLVTIGVFSAVHILGYIGTYPLKTLLLCLLQYLGPSLILCRVCRKSDSLCAPLMLHMMINVLACLFVE